MRADEFITNDIYGEIQTVVNELKRKIKQGEMTVDRKEIEKVANEISHRMEIDPQFIVSEIENWLFRDNIMKNVKTTS